MKLKLRILEDIHVRDLRERAEARREVEVRKTRWQAAEYSLHQEFSRIGPNEQPIFQLRAHGPQAAALNRELAGLEFFGCQGWYHPASQTAALERFVGEALPAVCLLNLATHTIVDVAPRQRLIWRSPIHGALLVHSDAGFAVVDARRRLRVILADHAHGLIIDDMLVAFNEHDPRMEITLFDLVSMQYLDGLGPDAIATELGVEFGHDLSIRFLHRSELELCFELLMWNGGRSTAIRSFAVSVTCIALGTVDE